MLKRLRHALLGTALLLPLSGQSPEALRTRLKASLVQFRELNPEQQQRVLATLEAEAKVASPNLQPILLAVLEELRRTPPQKLPPTQRLRGQLDRLAKLPPAQRRKVIARMEILAAEATPELKAFWELLLKTAKALE